MTNADRISKLNAVIDAEKQKHAVAKATHEEAKRRYDDAVETLKIDFGVKSIDEAKSLLVSLEQKMNQDIEKAEKALEESQ